MEAQRAAIDEVSPTTVVDTLTAWQRSGDLPRMLATADGATLRVWARVMLEELSAAGNIRGQLAGSLASPWSSESKPCSSNPETSAALLAQELVRIVAARSAPQADAAADPVVRGN